MDAIAARRRTPLQHQLQQQLHQYPATTSSFLPSAAAPAASGLNPNAPLFVPRAYRAVEDFSDQWYRLVETSAWFRDYWFRRQQEQQQQLLQQGNSKEGLEQASAGVGFGEADTDEVLLPDADALFHGYQPAEEEKRYTRNTTTTLSWVSGGIGGGAFSSSAASTAADDWRYVDRAARAMNINASPWVMQHQM